MKLNTKTILFAAALTALTLVLGGCDLFGPKTDPISASETMQGFVNTANSGAYGSLKGYTHSDAGAYGQADYNYWQTRLSAFTPIENLVVSGNSATATGVGVTFSFTLQEDEPEQYKIRTISRSGETIFQ